MVKLKCPYCNTVSDESKWSQSFLECELCGNQESIVCPNFWCGAEFSECSFEYPKEIKEVLTNEGIS